MPFAELARLSAFSGNMRLEHWDPVRRKYLLYRGAGEHHGDCVRYPYERIPRRIFLDTNVINLLVKVARSGL